MFEYALAVSYMIKPSSNRPGISVNTFDDNISVESLNENQVLPFVFPKSRIL